MVALAEACYVDPGAVVGGGPPDVGRPDPGVRRLVEGNVRVRGRRLGNLGTNPRTVGRMLQSGTWAGYSDSAVTPASSSA